MKCLDCRVSVPEVFSRKMTALRCLHPRGGDKHGRVTHLYKTGEERAYLFEPPAWCPKNHETERN